MDPLYRNKDSKHYRDYWEGRNNENSVTKNERKMRNYCKIWQIQLQLFWEICELQTQIRFWYIRISPWSWRHSFCCYNRLWRSRVLAEFFSSVFTLETDNPVDHGKRYYVLSSSDSPLIKKTLQRYLRKLTRWNQQVQTKYTHNFYSSWQI